MSRSNGGGGGNVVRVLPDGPRTKITTTPPTKLAKPSLRPDLKASAAPVSPSSARRGDAPTVAPPPVPEAQRSSGSPADMEDLYKRQVGARVHALSFERLRTEKRPFVDKSQFITPILNARRVLLSRPRGFGRTIIMSMMDAFFRCKTKLFEGLSVMRNPPVLDDGYHWSASTPAYPVVHIPMAMISYGSTGRSFERALLDRLFAIASEYGLRLRAKAMKEAMVELVCALAEHPLNSWGKVVVLIDDYDLAVVSQLAGVPGDEQALFADASSSTTVTSIEHQTIQRQTERARANFNVLSQLLEAVSVVDSHLRLFMLMGRTSVAAHAPSLFELRDYSVDPVFSDVCGFSWEECMESFGVEVAELRQRCQVNEETIERTVERWFGGYRFGGLEAIIAPTSFVRLLRTAEFRSHTLMASVPQRRSFMSAVDPRQIAALAAGRRVALSDLPQVLHDHLFYHEPATHQVPHMPTFYLDETVFNSPPPDHPQGRPVSSTSTTVTATSGAGRRSSSSDASASSSSGGGNKAVKKSDSFDPAALKKRRRSAFDTWGRGRKYRPSAESVVEEPNLNPVLSNASFFTEDVVQNSLFAAAVAECAETPDVRGEMAPQQQQALDNVLDTKPVLVSHSVPLHGEWDDANSRFMVWLWHAGLATAHRVDRSRFGTWADIQIRLVNREACHVVVPLVVQALSGASSTDVNYRLLELRAHINNNKIVAFVDTISRKMHICHHMKAAQDGCHMFEGYFLGLMYLCASFHGLSCGGLEADKIEETTDIWVRFPRVLSFFRVVRLRESDERADSRGRRATMLAQQTVQEMFSDRAFEAASHESSIHQQLPREYVALSIVLSEARNVVAAIGSEVFRLVNGNPVGCGYNLRYEFRPPWQKNPSSAAHSTGLIDTESTRASTTV